MEMTFTVPARNLLTLTARLDKLARKANKYGNDPVGYTIGETVTREIKTDNGKIEIDFVEIAVYGDAPKYGNYTFLAKVELHDGENIVHNMTGTELNPRFRNMVSECDHCGHNRVRNDVYVFADESGNQLAVGRTCLRDFTGCDNPLEITNRAEWFSIVSKECDDEFDSYMGGFGKWFYSTDKVMQYAAANVREYGWMSKANADYDSGNMPTNDRVIRDLNPTGKHRPIEITEPDIALATETIEYFRNLPIQVNSDYLNNLRVILKSKDIDPKHIGLAVSAISVILRNKSKASETNNAKTESLYFGQEGTRYRAIELTFNREIAMGDNGYGEQYMYCFTDNKGNQFTWFTSHREFEIGNTYKMDFTVKAHREYRGIKQTNITRASIK